MAGGNYVFLIFILVIVLLNGFLIFGGYLFGSSAPRIEHVPTGNIVMENPLQPLVYHNKTYPVPNGSVLVMFDRSNGFRDDLEEGYFTRNFTSGPGTGIFIGRDYEFAWYECNSSEIAKIEKSKWVQTELGCGIGLLSRKWCAREKNNPSLNYTLEFVAWTTGPLPDLCEGYCDFTNNRTAYIRTRS